MWMFGDLRLSPPHPYHPYHPPHPNRYKEGQGFGPHYDEEDACPATARASCYTLLLYLNDVAAGGCACAGCGVGVWGL